MGTKAQRRSPSKIVLTKKPTTTTEHSSAQIIKQPQQKKKKKHTRRRRIKSQQPQLAVHGKSCSIHGLAPKGLPPGSQESTTKSCYCDVNTGNVLSKTDNSGGSHNAKLETENKNTSGKEGVEHSEKSKHINIIRENKRSLKYPSVVEKRKYQAVSEYQFIYPGKSVFHCTQDNTKQHLRSIYQGKADPKPLRSNHLSVQMPQCQWEICKAQRGNVIAEANCPVGSDFLRSTHLRKPAQGLISLTCKINKLFLVNEKDQVPTENTPSIHAVNPYLPQLQRQSISEKARPFTKAFQRSKHYTAKKEGWGEQQQPEDAPVGLRGLPAPLENSPRLRPVSAKEHYKKALDYMFGRKRNENEDLAEKKRAAPNIPGVDAHSKNAVTQTKSAIIIPTISQYLSSENLSTKGPPLGWKTASQFLADKKMPVGIPAHSSEWEMGQGSFTAALCSLKDEPSNTGS